MPKTKNLDGLKLDDFLCFAVYAAGHAFNRVYKPLLDELGLTYPQYLVMTALWGEDDKTVGALGGQLSLEYSTLTPLLKRLERLGMISRRRDPEDERQVRVRLTAEGKALQLRASSLPSCIQEASGLSETDLNRLKEDIVRLRESLDRYAASHAGPTDRR
jgi:DNA-binding MarR family transcriptional regulator